MGIGIERYNEAIQEAKSQLANECEEALRQFSGGRVQTSFEICRLPLPDKAPNSLSYPRPHFLIYTYQEDGSITELEFLGYHDEKNRLKRAEPKNVSPEEVPFSKLSVNSLREIATNLQAVTSQIPA